MQHNIFIIKQRILQIIYVQIQVVVCGIIQKLLILFQQQLIFLI